MKCYNKNRSLSSHFTRGREEVYGIKEEKTLIGLRITCKSNVLQYLWLSCLGFNFQILCANLMFFQKYENFSNEFRSHT